MRKAISKKINEKCRKVLFCPFCGAVNGWCATVLGSGTFYFWLSNFHVWQVQWRSVVSWRSFTRNIAPAPPSSSPLRKWGTFSVWYRRRLMGTRTWCPSSQRHRRIWILCESCSCLRGSLMRCVGVWCQVTNLHNGLPLIWALWCWIWRIWVVMLPKMWMLKKRALSWFQGKCHHFGQSVYRISGVHN